MLLKKMHNMLNSLAFRLTVMYAGIFAISSLVAFFIFFLMMRADINRQSNYSAYLKVVLQTMK